MREWAEADPADAGAAPKRVRQVLSSNPGQRPSKWLEWDDLRKQMLGWAGYKLMLLRKES